MKRLAAAFTFLFFGSLLQPAPSFAQDEFDISTLTQIGDDETLKIEWNEIYTGSYSAHFAIDIQLVGIPNTETYQQTHLSPQVTELTFVSANNTEDFNSYTRRPSRRVFLIHGNVINTFIRNAYRLDKKNKIQISLVQFQNGDKIPFTGENAIYSISVFNLMSALKNGDNEVSFRIQGKTAVDERNSRVTPVEAGIRVSIQK